MNNDYDIKNINFIRKGSGKKVLLLHGWQANIETFKPVFDILSKKYDVIAVDFPGFGNSKIPPSNWDIFDYANIIQNFIKYYNFHPCTIIGHSFGGRIAIILGARANELIEKLILVDSAGLKPKRKLKYFLKVYSYKTIKFFLRIYCLFFKKEFNNTLKKIRERLKIKGSIDYENAGNLKEIFVRVVNQDLSKFAKKIKKPTLIIWGENDIDTPLYMAKKLNKLIKDSGIVILENAAHYSYLDNFNKFIRVVDYFISNA